MKMTLMAAFMALNAFSLNALAHGDEPRVSIEPESSVSVRAGDVSFEFDLVDGKDKIVLKDKDLTIEHEKILHAFFFDPALKEFRHEHPVFDGTKWHVTTNLPVNGEYWFWVQGKIASDGEEFSSNTRLNVANGLPANALPPILGDVRSGTDGVSKVVLSKTNLVAKQMVMPTLSLTRTDGTAAKITPYLGALAHVVGVLEDGDTLLHVHPMAMGHGNDLMLHMEFPEAGQYRLWVQFIDDGVLKTVPLSVVVSEAK